MKSLIIQTFRSYWLIILLTIVGAFLRLYNIKPTISFLGDQGRDVRIVRNLLQKADPILVGPTTSVGKIQLGPLYYYYMAPWLLIFNYDPVGPAVGVALLGIVTIPVLYFLTKRMFGYAEAFFITILYTFSAIVIQYSRFSWNPNPMPLFAILLLYSVYESYERKSNKHLILSFLWFGIALQLHYMVLLLLPFFLLMLVLTGKDTKDRCGYTIALLKGCAVFVVLLMPLVIFDLRHDFLNTKGFLEFFQKGHHSPQAWYQPVLEIRRRVVESFGNIISVKTTETLRMLISFIPLFLITLLTVAKKSNKGLLVVLSYTLISIVGLSLYRGDVFLHYVGFFFPMPFIITGILLGFLWRKGKQIGRVLVCITILLYLALQYQPEMLYRPLGWQIDDVRQLATDIASDAKEPYNIVLLDDTKDYPGMNYRYFLEMSSNPPANELNYNGIRTLYVISQYQDLSSVNLEVRELETFFNQKINNLQRTDDADIITDKIVKNWSYPKGNWVYKVQR